jgi:hypothetical protein
MNDEITVQEVEEIPWGPGSLTLLSPLELTVEKNKHGDISLYSESFQISGQGESFDDALSDFSMALEEMVDTVTKSDVARLNDQKLQALYETILDYIPEEVIF